HKGNPHHPPAVALTGSSFSSLSHLYYPVYLFCSFLFLFYPFFSLNSILLQENSPAVSFLPAFSSGVRPFFLSPPQAEVLFPEQRPPSGLLFYDRKKRPEKSR